jgi:hypothetical protein
MGLAPGYAFHALCMVFGAFLISRSRATAAKQIASA